MIFAIADVLTPEEIADITSILSQSEFVDGKLTAGWHAKLVKHNQQLKAGTLLKELQTKVRVALNRNPLLQTAIRPQSIHSLLFSRYHTGMSYDTHIDNALMNGKRADVSFTLFLNPATDYEGGELVIEGARDEQAYKLDAGAAIVYPSTTLHRVNPVTKGTRLVAVGWVQSWVRDASNREILFDLDTARRSLFAQQGKTPEFDLISKSIANLLRKWNDV